MNLPNNETPVPASADTHLPSSVPPPSVVTVQGDEQSRIINMQKWDGLKPVIGVHNIQVFRSSPGKPELADGDGWTYAHHMDLAVWKGRMYAAWAMTPKDEDAPPYKVVYATSTDGIHWSAPADLFPREHTWACRFYFYRATNGRMLAFCAGKSADGSVSEATKKMLLVREVADDHRLGKVFTLITPLPDQPAYFETATDLGFVAACREAAGNNLLLEQQDYGVLLGDRRMPWHTNFKLKAFCFYHCADGALIGLGKFGFATLSADEGKTWSQPVQTPTLVTDMGKVWGQRTSDGGGWRKLLQDKLRAAGMDFEFTGDLDYWAFGRDGVVDPAFDPHHHGLAGFGNVNIMGGGVVPTFKDVLDAKGVKEIRVPDIVTVLKKHQPTVVLLMSGSNGFNAVARDQLIRTIAANLTGHLFVATIPPQKLPRAGHENVDAYNRSLPQIVAELQAAGTKIHFVDINATLNADDISADGVHPTADGMKKMAQCWFDALCKAEIAKMDNSQPITTKP